MTLNVANHGGDHFHEESFNGHLEWADKFFDLASRESEFPESEFS